MAKAVKIDETQYHKLVTTACFVCRIVEGRPLLLGVQVVYEDDFCIAFLNQFPTQEGYTIVAPKRHVERFESDMTSNDWATLQIKVQEIARAVAKSTNAMRMYIASWGRPDRNSHVHVHVCPCPHGLPDDKQELAAMTKVNGEYLLISDAKMKQISEQIKRELVT